MREEIGHTLRRVQQFLEKRDYKSFTDEIRKLYELLKDSESPIEEVSRFLADISLKIYYNFDPLPAMELYANAEKVFPPTLVSALKEKLKPELELFIHWQKQMEYLTRERYAREIRETIRSDDYQQAIKVIRNLIGVDTDKEEFKHNLEICGSVLGSLENDQPRVDKVIALLRQQLKELGLSMADVEVIDKVRHERFRLMFKTRLENRELEWTRALSDSARELKNFLPLANELGEPTAEEFARFRSLLQAIFNTPFEPEKNHRWTDIAFLLTELSPASVSTTAMTAGVEKRIYEGLGPKARLIVARSFKQVGENSKLCHTFLKYVQHSLNVRYYKYAMELMTLLGSPLFIPFLLDSLQDKRLASIKGELTLALGNIGNPEVAPPLVAELRKTLNVRVIDPPRVRRALEILRALVKIFYSPPSTPQEKNKIIDAVIKAVPELEAHLCRDTALIFFSPPEAKSVLPELKKEHVAWAVSSLVKGLWLKDPTPAFAQGEETPRTILGFRERIADTLIALGNSIIPYITDSVSPQLHLFCGAYMAIGEILAQIGDERAIPLLEKMLLNTYITDEKKTTIYEQEYYWDAAAGKREPLTRDKIAAALIYALDKINTPKGEEILLNLMKQIQLGQISPLGTESATVLVNANMRIARERGTSAFAPPLPQKEAQLLKDEKELNKLASFVKRSSLSAYLPLLKSKVREQKILAIKELSEAAEPEAIKAIVSALLDKDRLVREAAATAIFELLRPPSTPEKIETLCQELISALERHAGGERGRILQNVIRRLDLSRPVIKDSLTRAMKAMKNKRMLEFITELLVTASEKPSIPQVSAVTKEPAKAEALSDKIPAEQAEEKKPKKFVDKIELRRRYLEERRRWIQSGKKGPPPELPPALIE